MGKTFPLAGKAIDPYNFGTLSKETADCCALPFGHSQLGLQKDHAVYLFRCKGAFSEKGLLDKNGILALSPAESCLDTRV